MLKGFIVQKHASYRPAGFSDERNPASPSTLMFFDIIIISRQRRTRFGYVQKGLQIGLTQERLGVNEELFTTPGKCEYNNLLGQFHYISDCIQGNVTDISIIGEIEQIGSEKPFSLHYISIYFQTFALGILRCFYLKRNNILLSLKRKTTSAFPSLQAYRD